MRPTLTRPLLALFILTIGIAPVVAHNPQPAWLDADSLDRGVSVMVRHPGVLRSAIAFDISVFVANVDGESSVRVREVRYFDLAQAGVTARRFDHELATRREWFREYGSVRHELTHPAAPTEEKSELSQRQTLLVAQIARDAFSDRYSIDPAAIARSGDQIRMRVEIDLEQDGSTRTVHKTVTIPIRAPLPDGRRSETYLDASTGRTRPMSDLLEPAAVEELWFAGDQHLHTRYSIDAYFTNGNRSNVFDYAAVAQAVGLDWIVVTDHSNIDFGFLGQRWYTPQQFAAGTAEAAQYRAQFGFLVLNGQEMGAGAGDPAHVLAYPKNTDSMGFLPNPCSSGLFGQANCEPEQTILDRINGAGGIGFIAHPFQTSSGFFGPWNFNNGVTGWAGFEVFNSGSGILTAADRQALLKWLQLLKDVQRPAGGELPLRDDYPTKFPVGLGNSDAHEPGLIGNTFTYCRAESATREAVMGSLAEGRCVVSNGPLAFMEVGGAGPGEVAVLSPSGNTLSLTIQSTPEFGPAGAYQILLFLDGVQAAKIGPSGSPDFSTTTVFPNIKIGGNPKYIVTIAVGPSGRLSIANPVWLETP